MKFATIGTGKIVRNFLNASEHCEGLEPTVFYSRSRERAAEFAQSQGYKVSEQGSCILCDSLEELMKHPLAEAVYIASPTCAHCEQTIKMLSGGKHVLCEKPAASNYREWEKMLESARSNNRTLLEAMRPIFTPGYKVIQENLYRVGKIRKAFIQYCQYSSRYDKFKNGIIENAFRPELSNGALMDIGIYCIEVMVGLFGTPQSIQAQSYIIPGSIDGEGTILAEYPEMQAIVSYSKIADSALPCEIQGEAGTLTWNTAGAPENVTFTSRSGEKTQLFGSLPIPNMAYEERKFLRLCKTGEQPLEYNRITSESLKITDEVRRQCHIVFPAD